MLVAASIILAYGIATAIMAPGGLRKLAFFTVGLLIINSLALPTYLVSLPDSVTRNLHRLSLLSGAAVVFSVALFSEGGVSKSIDRLSRNFYMLSFLWFALAVFLQYLNSDEKTYGMRKTVYFVIHSVLPLIGLAVNGRVRRTDLYSFALGVCMASAAVGLSMLTSSVAFGDFSGRSSLGDEIHPNNVARNIGSGICLILNIVLFRRPRVWISLMLLTVAAVCVVPMLMTGSRGVLIAVGLSVVVPLVYAGQWRAIFRTATGCSVLALSVWVLPQLPLDRYAVFEKIDVSAPLQRIVGLLERSGRNQSDVSRLARYEVAWKGFVKSGGVGVGTGGFLGIWDGPRPGGIFADRDYPHNIFLEIAVEQGVAGLLCFCCMLYFLVARLLARRLEGNLGDVVPILTGLWIYGFANAMVSGDVGTNFLLFVAGGILYSAAGPSSTDEETVAVSVPVLAPDGPFSRNSVRS